MKSITLTVPQGLGDIFWVYQLYAKKFDVINFTIGIANKPNEIQLRAVDWLYTLPKVGNVDWVQMEIQPYRELLAYDGPLLEEDGVYACNKPLERGVRLEELGDPQWDVPVRMNDVIGFNYTCLYVSGNAKMNGIEGQWQDYEWIEFVKLFHTKYPNTPPMVVIGAEFDRDMVEFLCENILNVTSFIAEPPSKVLTVIKKANFFIGYQSGLGVMADNLDTPQLMMYFEKYQDLRYAWCKPQNVKTKFHADTMDRSPSQVIESLEWKP